MNKKQARTYPSMNKYKLDMKGLPKPKEYTHQIVINIIGHECVCTSLAGLDWLPSGRTAASSIQRTPAVTDPELETVGGILQSPNHPDEPRPRKLPPGTLHIPEVYPVENLQARQSELLSLHTDSYLILVQFIWFHATKLTCFHIFRA